MAKKENIVFQGTGRRKKSIARVRLMDGNGKITINGKDLNDYFGTEILKVIVNQPFSVTNTTGKYDVIAKVETYKKYAQPDTGAAHLLLKNLDPNWHNDDAETLDIKKKQVELQKQKLEQDNW